MQFPVPHFSHLVKGDLLELPPALAEVAAEELRLPLALAEVVAAFQKLQLLAEAGDFVALSVARARAKVQADVALLLVWLLLTGWSC